MLAAKTALAVRYDALGEDDSQDVGMQGRAIIQDRLKQVEQGQVSKWVELKATEMIGYISDEENQWHRKGIG